jgi:hypothetical protein
MSKELEAGLKEAAAGEDAVARATEQYLGPRRNDGIDRIRDRASFPEPRPEPPPATGSMLPTVAEMGDHIARADAMGRWTLAGLGLARLRERFEAEDPKAGQTFMDFARENVPMARDRVEELLGRMVHRGALLRCIKCGIGAKAPCGCGAHFVSERPTLTKATALERAAAAVAAHPEKSNRVLAAEIGVGAETVRRARAGAKGARADGATMGQEP